MPLLSRVLALGLLAAVVSAPAQTERPQATVTVRPQTGGDLVDVTALAPDYPVAALRDAAVAIGVNAGAGRRPVLSGAQTLGAETGGSLVQASIVTTGLTDPAAGVYRLQPIAAALAGARPPIREFVVVFERARPTEETLAGFESESARVGVARSSDGGLEYRVQVVKPEGLAIPDRRSARPAAKPPAPPARGPDPVLFALAAIAALAVGASVYSLLRRGRPARR